MKWTRLFTMTCAWLALSGAASAQEQLSIRCMTVEPDEAARGRIDEVVRRNGQMRAALGFEAAGTRPGAAATSPTGRYSIRSTY
jgi:hypothetical protein